MHRHGGAADDGIRGTTEGGMFAMMAMMAVCCIGVLVLFALIPLVGWTAGLIIAVSAGTALMYAHWKLMDHGSGH